MTDGVTNHVLIALAHVLHASERALPRSARRNPPLARICQLSAALEDAVLEDGADVVARAKDDNRQLHPDAPARDI